MQSNNRDSSPIMDRENLLYRMENKKDKKISESDSESSNDEVDESILDEKCTESEDVALTENVNREAGRIIRDE